MGCADSAPRPLIKTVSPDPDPLTNEAKRARPGANDTKKGRTHDHNASTTITHETASPPDLPNTRPRQHARSTSSRDHEAVPQPAATQVNQPVRAGRAAEHPEEHARRTRTRPLVPAGGDLLPAVPGKWREAGRGAQPSQAGRRIRGSAPLLTTPAAAALLGISTTTLRRLTHAGEIPYVLIGRGWRRYTEQDLGDFIRARRRRVCQDHEHGSSTSGRARRPGSTTGRSMGSVPEARRAMTTSRRHSGWRHSGGGS